MENYELYIPDINRKFKGQYQKGHIPWNKGIPMKQWMDGRKIEKVLKCLEIGRKLGNSVILTKINSKCIIGIKAGKSRIFKNSIEAEKVLKSEGIAVNSRNIRAVCNEKLCKWNGVIYVRKKAGGYQWFDINDYGKYKSLLI